MLWDGVEPVSPEIASHKSQVNAVAADMCEPSTLEQRTSLLRSFQVFCVGTGPPINSDAIPMFLESRELKYSTRLQYGTTLKALLTKDILTVDAHLAGCRKRAARDDVRQAEGIRAEDMKTVMAAAPTAQDATMMKMAWMTASRWAEAKGLRTGNLIPQTDGSVAIDLAAAPKTAKTHPFRAHRYARLTGEVARELTALCKGLRPDQPLARTTTQQMAANLRPMGCPAHPIERGALQQAAAPVSSHRLPERQLVSFAKHADPLAIPSTTVRHLGTRTATLTASQTPPALL
ncbi:hypothetical protein NESM_000324200 [Novymonas esmeraldas]|uniref:Integrase n=1 Tax=Novymonas esmeraldas TaxID=1808958 RepID=A0AAW0ELG9_9TRYP